MEETFYIGSYADDNTDSILRVRADFAKGELRQEYGWKGILNPSWILFHPNVFHPNEKILYAVNEKTPDGGLSAFRMNGDSLEKVAQFATEGADPCHLSLDDTGRFLFVANYTSGSLAVFALDEEGIPIRMSDHQQHAGKGIHPTRQEGPHVHFSMFHDGELFAVDLGLDKVCRYSLDREYGTLTEVRPFVELPAGNGPRHFAFSPMSDRLYVLCELTSELCVYERQESGRGIPSFSHQADNQPTYETKPGQGDRNRKVDSEFVLLQRISTLPDDFTGENTAAAIRFSSDGRYIFTSNRGHDSIAVFRVGEDGRLTRIQIQKTGGRTPRDFVIAQNPAEDPDGYLLIANQDSRDLTTLIWESHKEQLIATDMRLHTQGRPVCICATKG